MSATDVDATRIHDLKALLEAQDNGKMPPVEAWDPPYRGNIGLEILADGSWSYRNSPINRPALVRLFARVLRRDPDGRHYLVTPVERFDIAIADAPFRAVELQIEGTGQTQQLVFRTNVDDIVHCGPDHPLRFEQESGNGGLKPYLLVRGRLEALVTRALCYDLVELALQPGERPPSVSAEQPGLWSGGQFFELT